MLSVSIGQRVNPRDMCFSSYATKENLIEIITQELFVRYRNIVSSHRLVITSNNEVSQELPHGIKISRFDLRSNFDEADYVIQQQVHSLVMQGNKNSIKVISADTDVFVLLCTNFATNQEKEKRR